MRTIVGLNDPKAVKRYSGYLAVDSSRKGYWTRKFMGTGEDASMPVQMLPHLENDAGEQITYDLVMQLKMKPIEGDDKLKGNEEQLKFYTDNVYIDQSRGGVNSGGRMTRKRTLHNLRKIARTRQSEWWARCFDEQFFMYGSGARGINADYIFDTGYTGRANNAFSAPDTNHILYSGAATSKATLAATDKMTLGTIDRLVAKATMMGGGTTGIPQIQPIMVDGEEHYVLVMTPWDEYNMRTNATAGQWLDIQKAAATAEGRKSPIFKGGLGMYNDVVLHKHKAVVRFNDYGAGGNVAASRSLFLGTQAMVCAFGSPGTNLRFEWHEEQDDRGNEVIITTHAIYGVKKCSFTIGGVATDFGVIAVESAAADPG